MYYIVDYFQMEFILKYLVKPILFKNKLHQNLFTTKQGHNYKTLNTLHHDVYSSLLLQVNHYKGLLWNGKIIDCLIPTDLCLPYIRMPLLTAIPSRSLVLPTHQLTNYSKPHLWCPLKYYQLNWKRHHYMWYRIPTLPLIYFWIHS